MRLRKILVAGLICFSLLAATTLFGRDHVDFTYTMLKRELRETVQTVTLEGSIASGFGEILLKEKESGKIYVLEGTTDRLKRMIEGGIEAIKIEGEVIAENRIRVTQAKTLNL